MTDIENYVLNMKYFMKYGCYLYTFKNTFKTNLHSLGICFKVIHSQDICINDKRE